MIIDMEKNRNLVYMMFVTLVLLASCAGKGFSNKNIEGQYAYARFYDNTKDMTASVYIGGMVEFKRDGQFEDNRIVRFYENFNTGLQESEYRVVYKGTWSIEKDTLRLSLSQSPVTESRGRGGYYYAKDNIAEDYAPSDCKIISIDNSIVVKYRDALMELIPRSENIKPIPEKEKEKDEYLISNRGVGRYTILYPFYYEHPEEIRKVVGDKYNVERFEGMYNYIYTFTLKNDTTVTFEWDDNSLVFKSPQYHTPSGLHVGSTLVDFLFVNGFSRKSYMAKYAPEWVTDGEYIYLLRNDEPVSSHYIQGDDYYEKGDITNLNAVIFNIVATDDSHNY